MLFRNVFLVIFFLQRYRLKYSNNGYQLLKQFFFYYYLFFITFLDFFYCSSRYQFYLLQITFFQGINFFFSSIFLFGNIMFFCDYYSFIHICNPSILSWRFANFYVSHISDLKYLSFSFILKYNVFLLFLKLCDISIEGLNVK